MAHRDQHNRIGPVPGAFSSRVYALCRMVPRGRVTTYSEIARAMGSGAYRAVGSALSRNPFAPRVPCHRVINSDGRIGGFSAGKKEPNGKEKKARLLKKEGVDVRKGRIVLSEFFFSLEPNSRSMIHQDRTVRYSQGKRCDTRTQAKYQHYASGLLRQSRTP